MLKSIILFFRKRNIRKNLQKKRVMQFPDLDKFPIISLLVSENQKKNIKEIELFLKNSYNPKRLRFIIMSEVAPDNMLQSDYMICITKEDFNRFGFLKKEKEELLRASHDDIFINLLDSDEELLNDYIVSFIKSSFKIGHAKANMDMYDLILDFGIEKGDVQRLKILYKYLMMLSGNKNEK